MRSECGIVFGDSVYEISLDDIACDLPKISIETNSSNSLLNKERTYLWDKNRDIRMCPISISNLSYDPIK